MINFFYYQVKTLINFVCTSISNLNILYYLVLHIIIGKWDSNSNSLNNGEHNMSMSYKNHENLDNLFDNKKKLNS